MEPISLTGLFESKREIFRASTVMASLLKNLLTFSNSLHVHNSRHIKRDARLLFSWQMIRTFQLHKPTARTGDFLVQGRYIYGEKTHRGMPRWSRYVTVASESQSPLLMCSSLRKRQFVTSLLFMLFILVTRG
jgi:hypothetical protein